MLHYFRKAIQLATETQGQVFWAKDPIGYTAYGYVVVNDNLLNIRVYNTTIVVGHKRSSGFQRLSCVRRTQNSTQDLASAINFALLDN